MHFALCLLINCISFVLFQLYIESSLGLEVAYNNESIGVWEPLIEPVLDTKGEYHKWSIGLEVRLQSKWIFLVIWISHLSAPLLFASLYGRCWLVA